MDLKGLEEAVSQARMDASNVNLAFEDAQVVALSLKRAEEHLAFAKSELAKRDEHIRSGFAEVGKARGVLGKSPVQSPSFRRHQWPFVPPEVEEEK